MRPYRVGAHSVRPSRARSYDHPRQRRLRDRGGNPAGARMVYSDYPCYSPIFCASGTGFFLEAIYRHGGTEPSVIETKCQTLGDHTCTYEMTWR